MAERKLLVHARSVLASASRLEEGVAERKRHGVQTLSIVCQRSLANTVMRETLGLLRLKRSGDLLAKADALLLANDSMFYPACIQSLVSKLINRDGQWLCLFENFEINPCFSGKSHTRRAP